MTQHSSNPEETPTPESLHHLLDQPIDVKLQLLQHHAEVARLLAGEILEEEVESLVAEHLKTISDELKEIKSVLRDRDETEEEMSDDAP